MHTTLALLAALATLTAAQTTTTGAYSCAAENILQACLATTQAQLLICAANDWDCLCNQYGNVLTCYNNCPGDPGRFGVTQQQQQNCQAASVYGSSRTSSTMSASSTGSAVIVTASTVVVGASTMSTATNMGSQTTNLAGSATRGSSASAAAASGTNAAGGMGIPAVGGLVVGVVGLVGLI